jgi:hypothetical protein
VGVLEDAVGGEGKGRTRGREMSGHCSVLGSAHLDGHDQLRVFSRLRVCKGRQACDREEPREIRGFVQDVVKMRWANEERCNDRGGRWKHK